MPTEWTREGGEEWGPWIVHDGRGCPLQVGTIVEVYCKDGFGLVYRQVSQVRGGQYSSWDWTHYPELKKILRYRQKKPRGLQILEGNLREQETPKEPSKVFEND